MKNGITFQLLQMNYEQNYASGKVTLLILTHQGIWNLYNSFPG